MTELARKHNSVLVVPLYEEDLPGLYYNSATVAGLSEYLWKLEQPAHAVANQYFIGAINRPGFEEPWRIGEFYGQSYFCDPRGQMLAVGSRDSDDIVIADLNLDLIR